MARSGSATAADPASAPTPAPVPLRLPPQAPAVIDPASAPCLYCGIALLPRPLVLCTRCQAPHHADCWQENRGRYTTYGCEPDTDD